MPTQTNANVEWRRKQDRLERDLHLNNFRTCLRHAAECRHQGGAAFARFGAFLAEGSLSLSPPVRHLERLRPLR